MCDIKWRLGIGLAALRLFFFQQKRKKYITCFFNFIKKKDLKVKFLPWPFEHQILPKILWSGSPSRTNSINCFLNFGVDFWHTLKIKFKSK